MTDVDASLVHCVVCDIDMTEVFHYPVLNHCDCKTRICQSCRHRIKQCPTCRCSSLGSSTMIDYLFLEKMILAVKGKTCEGCGHFIRSRHRLKHGKECPKLLVLRLAETMDDNKQKESSYRSVLQENEQLSTRVNDMHYQLHFFRSYYHRPVMHPRFGARPPLPPLGDSDGESDVEMELETHVVHPVPLRPSEATTQLV